jgi:hypothetical protein
MSATAERIARDLAFMQTPSEWPRWPLLPLVHRQLGWGDRKGCALLFADGRPVIYFANLLMLPKASGQTWGELLEGIEHQEYPTFEALAQDYRVD